MKSSKSELESTPIVQNETNQQSDIAFYHFLQQPLMLMPFLDLFAAMCGNGMLESMLEPHLKDYGASEMDVGITFLVYGCLYMGASLIVGQVIDNCGNPLLFCTVGNALFIIVFTSIGPLPFLSMTLTLGMIKGVMAVAGISYATLVVSSYSLAQHNLIKFGYKNNMQTHNMISGIWLSAFSLGNFVGPTAAGILVDKYGFQWMTLSFFILFSLVTVKDMIEAVVEKL